MKSYKFTYNNLTIGDMADVISYKQGSKDWVITVKEANGFSSPALRNTERSFSGNHGIVDYQTYIGKRTITFSGDIVARTENDILTAVKTLQTAFSLPAVYSSTINGYNELKWETQAGQEQFKCNAKISVLPRIQKTFKLQNMRTYFVSLKCDDPRLYSQAVYLYNLRRTWDMAGITLPTMLPIELSSKSVYRQNLINNGNFGTSPTIRISGYTQNPTLKNITHNLTMKFNTTLQNGEYLDIDVFKHKITDHNGTNRINDLDVNSQWLWLQAGDNYVDFTDDQTSPLVTGVVPQDQVTISFNYASV